MRELPIIQAFFDEIKSIKNSWYKLSLLFFIPFISFGLVWAIFYKAIATNLPIVVVDGDHTSFSKELIFNIDATQTLAVDYRVDDIYAAKELLKKTKVYAIVVLPNDLEKDILRHNLPTISVFTNAQFILIAKVINATLKSVFSSFDTKLQVASSLAKTPNPIQALHQNLPISFDVEEFFNPNGNYFYFLVLAISPAMWQIFITIGAIVAFGEMVKKQEYKHYLQKHMIQKIFGRLLPYSIVYVMWGFVLLWGIYGVYGWDFFGVFSGVSIGVFLTVFAYEAFGLLFLFFGADYARALSLAAVYTAPAFAFLGVTFPHLSMNSFALMWSKLLPVSHFMQVILLEANYAAPVHLVLERLLTLSSFLVIYLIVFGVIAVRVRR